MRTLKEHLSVSSSTAWCHSFQELRLYSLSVDMKKSDSIRQLRLNLKGGNVHVGHVQPLNC